MIKQKEKIKHETKEEFAKRLAESKEEYKCWKIYDAEEVFQELRKKYDY